MANRSIEIRIDDSVIKKVATAAFLKGMRDVSEYIVSLVEADSKKVIEQHDQIVLDHEDFMSFIKACESSDGPNEDLVKARQNARRQGIV